MHERLSLGAGMHEELTVVKSLIQARLATQDFWFGIKYQRHIDLSRLSAYITTQFTPAPERACTPLMYAPFAKWL